MKKVYYILFFTTILFSSNAFTQPLPKVLPETVGISSKHLGLIDSSVKRAVKENRVPGAAVLVARNGKIVYKKAFGLRSIEPKKTPLKDDMIFDLASVTKPVATATSIMILVEQGKLRLNDEVRRFLPDFQPYINENGKKQHARIYHLLTHTSGLRDYSNLEIDSLKKKYGGYCPEEIIKHLANIKKKNPPGKVYEYTCYGFIALANIVKMVSGEKFDEFTQKYIFKPLKMNSTTYSPRGALAERCVPTERQDGVPLSAVVHEVVAQLQGGVSGNAGLFSDLDDLAIFLQMMLNGGEYNGVRILSPLTVKLMTTIYPKTSFSGRGLGWDINSTFTNQRGDIFYSGSYGHTGFTGTSVNVDMPSQTIIIILTSSRHPDGKGVTTDLRIEIANIIAFSIIKN